MSSNTGTDRAAATSSNGGTTAVVAAASSVGMNLAAVNYWSTEFPFIDRMKSAGAWTAQGSNPGTIALDANGYPKAMPSGASLLYSMVALDPSSAGTDNTYVLTYSGSATFRIPGTTIVSSQPGKIVFKYTGTTGMQQLVVDSIDAGNPLTAVHIVREDQTALFAKGEIFNPAFTSKLADFDTLRFMDWSNTNNSTVTSWSNRTTLNSMSWATTSATSGVPIEAEVALANETHKNIWIDIPTQADDNYVKQTLQYVHDNLDPNLKVTVEYSNEVWNWSFQQSKYAQTAANALWGANGTATVSGGNEEYYGYRSAQIAAIAQQVFGAGSPRLNDVLATQAVNPGLSTYILQGVAKANVGSVSTLFGSYAITTYFGSELNGATAADRATILSWANSGAAGVTAAINELQNGGSLSSSFGSLASLVPFYSAQAAVAKKNGLDLVAYEGGLSLSATAFSAADQPTVLAFFAKLEADPRMGNLYAQMVSDFSAAGGTLLNAYTDAQSDRAAGLFGTLKSIYDTTTPAYAALTSAAAAATAAQTGTAVASASTTASTTVQPPTAATSAAIVATPATAAASATSATTPAITTSATASTVKAVASATITTALSTYTLDANGRNLTYSGSGSFIGLGNAQDNVLTGGAGAGGNRLYGYDGDDTLIGGSGNDILDGGTGADRMVGGAGDDSYYVDNPGDVVVENPGGGNDTVYSTIGYQLGDNVENLRLLGTAAIDGTGNAVANMLTGNAAANRLSGGAGNDYLSGGDGDDTLDGGDGDDTLDGGNGNDMLMGGAGNDILLGGAGNDTLIGGPGRDSLTGGAGADKFVFAPGDIGNSVTQTDVILDFTRSDGDKIDLSAFEKQSGGALSFIGSGAFTKHAGQIRVDSIGSYWNVTGDMNGDGVADFVLNVSRNSGALISSDFIL